MKLPKADFPYTTPGSRILSSVVCASAIPVPRTENGLDF